jgi:hypothetical protein
MCFNRVLKKLSERATSVSQERRCSKSTTISISKISPLNLSLPEHDPLKSGSSKQHNSHTKVVQVDRNEENDDIVATMASHHANANSLTVEEASDGGLEQTWTAASTLASTRLPNLSIYDLELYSLQQVWEQAHELVWQRRKKWWDANVAVREARERATQAEKQIAETKGQLLEAEEEESLARTRWEDAVSRRE